MGRSVFRDFQSMIHSDYEDIQLIPNRLIINSRSSRCNRQFGKRLQASSRSCNIRAILDEMSQEQLAHVVALPIMHRFDEAGRILSNGMHDQKGLILPFRVGVKENTNT